jgi:cbb3-type cytochrome oxidase subunit 3
MPAVHKSGLRRFADALGVIALAAVFLLISANAAF